MQREPSSEERKQFSKALGVLAEALGAELKLERLKVYCDLLLREYSAQELLGACERFSRELGRKFFPTVPEFHEVIIGNPEVNATKAIAVMEFAMKSKGGNESIQFADPHLTNAIESAGGWVWVCENYWRMESGEFGYWSHRFREVYVQSARERRAPVVKYLPGRFEMSNEASLRTFTRGLLPEPKVWLIASDSSVKCLPLAQIEPQHALVAASQKQLAAAEPFEVSHEDALNALDEFNKAKHGGNMKEIEAEYLSPEDRAQRQASMELVKR